MILVIDNADFRNMITKCKCDLCKVSATAENQIFLLTKTQISQDHMNDIVPKIALPPRNLFCTSSYVSPPPDFGDDGNFQNVSHQ